MEVKKALNKWRFVSGAVSLVIAFCAFVAGQDALRYGDYLCAVCEWYTGVVVAVAGLATIMFKCDNREAVTVAMFMHLSVVALGVVLALAGRLSGMSEFLLWSAVCCVAGYINMRVYNFGLEE